MERLMLCFPVQLKTSNENKSSKSTGIERIVTLPDLTNRETGNKLYRTGYGKGCLPSQIRPERVMEIVRTLHLPMVMLRSYIPPHALVFFYPYLIL